MAFRHGRFAEITVASVALSTFCDTADINIDVDTAETTTFGKTWKTNIAGVAGANLSLSGNYDPTATSGPASHLTSLVGDAPFAVLMYPGGNVAGQIQHSFNAILTNYAESSGVGDKVTFKAGLLADDAVTSTEVS